MPRIKGKVHSVKEQYGFIWFHIDTKAGKKWISLEKEAFDETFKDYLVKRLYSKHNRKTKNRIKKLKHKIKLLKKQENKEHKLEQREHEITTLKHSIKKDLHVNDLIGKKILFRPIL